MYEITNYTKQQAKKMGVEVRPSTKKAKKIDVYQEGKRIASIGATGYGDYPSFIKEKGKAYAEERRRLYHKRHTKQTLVEQLALKLLW